MNIKTFDKLQMFHVGAIVAKHLTKNGWLQDYSSNSCCRSPGIPVVLYFWTPLSKEGYLGNFKMADSLKYFLATICANFIQIFENLHRNLADNSTKGDLYSLPNKVISPNMDIELLSVWTTMLYWILKSNFVLFKRTISYVHKLVDLCSISH